MKDFQSFLIYAGMLKFTAVFLACSSVRSVFALGAGVSTVFSTTGATTAAGS